MVGTNQVVYSHTTLMGRQLGCWCHHVIYLCTECGCGSYQQGLQEPICAAPLILQCVKAVSERANLISSCLFMFIMQKQVLLPAPIYYVKLDCR